MKITILSCQECLWYGEPEELVALTDDIKDRDFKYCPRCEMSEFDEEEIEEEE